MTSHYFTNDSKLNEELKLITETINGITYRFYTDSGVFSKNTLDFGSVLLIKEVLKDIENKGKFLDLGCGYGPIGIVISKVNPKLVVSQTDINEKAVILAEKNSKLNDVITKTYHSDGFSNIKDSFNYITLNPPIRIGKKAVFELYQKAYEKLENEGIFWIVVRKKQGALSHLDYLKTIFKKTEITNKSKGYYVIKMQKSKIS